MTIKQVLHKCPVFATLTSDELAKIAALAVEREYEAGATICWEHDNAEELLVLTKGKAALQMMLPAAPSQPSRQTTVDVTTTNEIAGWSVVVEPFVYTFTAICLQNTTVIAINGAKLRELFQSNNHIGYEVLKGLIKVVAGRLDDTRRLLLSERLQIPKSD